MPKKLIAIKNLLALFLILALITVVVLSLTPLPKATLKNCTTHSGIVLNVSKDGGPGDIVIKLKDDNVYYYINRGTENGVSISELEKNLTNKNVELLAIKHWTPLDPSSLSKHIAQITVNGKVLYTEL